MVCSFDPDGAVAAALANAEVSLVEPVARELGPVGQIVNGIEAAARLVAETDAALVWPARLAWVDAETVTQLIETHGQHPGSVLRPAYRGDAGFPALVPLAHLDRAPVPRGGPDARRPVGRPRGWRRAVRDPRDRRSGRDPRRRRPPRPDLPPYDGPPAPVDAHEHEWGAGLADLPDDVPPTGPSSVAAAHP